MKSDYPEIKEENLAGKIDMGDYTLNKKHIFKAPEYWFRKNKNLEVMNFRLEDGIGPENENENMVMNWFIILLYRHVQIICISSESSERIY